MLVVVASRHDSAAQALTDRWAAGGAPAALLTAEDLSAAGWRHRPGADPRAGAGAAVVAGRVVPTAAIGGVLTRRMRVEEWELGRIVPADRAYVAAEMTAFLLAWLADLACPVLNRPAPGCLAGPRWLPEQWALAAARLGLPVRPVRRRATRRRRAGGAALADEAPPVTVTVVGDRCLGPVDAALAEAARRLAAASGAALLAVHFGGDRAGAPFVGADPWPDIAAPAVADAVLAFLQGAGR